MELAQAIKDVGAGKSLLDIRAAAALMARLRGAAEHNDPLSGLTDRERTLLGLLSEGLTNRRIAARIPLRTATTAIHAIGGLVKVEAAVIRGSPEIALIAESRYAAMVCVGSLGIGRLPHVLLGSTATGPAHKAHCPVAIIRTDHDAPASDAGWVAVVVDDSPSNDAVLEHGFWNGPLPCTPDTPMELLPSVSARPTGMRIAVRTIVSRIRGLSRVRAQINLYSAWVISSTKRVKNG